MSRGAATFRRFTIFGFNHRVFQNLFLEERLSAFSFCLLLSSPNSLLIALADIPNFPPELLAGQMRETAMQEGDILPEIEDELS